MTRSLEEQQKQSQALKSQKLELGALVVYHNEFSDEGPRVAMVVGCWRYTSLQSRVYEHVFNADPRTSTGMSGYVLLPSSGTGFIRSWFGDLGSILKRL